MIHPYLVAALWALQHPIRALGGNYLGLVFPGEMHPCAECRFWAEQINDRGLDACRSWKAALERADTPENARLLRSMVRAQQRCNAEKVRQVERQRIEDRRTIATFNRIFAQVEERERMERARGGRR